MSKKNRGMNSQQPTEPFQAEINSIKEKGKDLKGEQRENYRSIIQRLENNSHVLSDLCEEHTQLRERLQQVVKEKNEKPKNANLAAAIKHTNHDVVLLKRQIDALKHQKEASIKKQNELEVILANFNQAEHADHPEEKRIQDIKNKLDKAKIKNEETTHLMKVYQRIITLFDRQKNHYNPILHKKQAEIHRQQKDISELTLIARDSRHSLSVTSSEYSRVDAECNAARQKRDLLLSIKKEQAKATNIRQINDVDIEQKVARPQPSLNSQPSVLRNKINKAAREKREERFRQVSTVYEEIRDRFGTTDPEKIQKFFEERKENTETLKKQIDDLKADCDVLEKRSDHLRSALDEAEFASSKGVGGSRLLAEGKKILEQKRIDLYEDKKQVAAQEVHQKSIKSGIIHLAEVMSLVQTDPDELSNDPEEILNWCTQKCTELISSLDEEDIDFTSIINKPAFVAFISRTEVDFDFNDTDLNKRMSKKPFEGHKRAPKEKAPDISTRVLDRAQVKLAALKAVQQSQQQKKARA